MDGVDKSHIDNLDGWRLDGQGVPVRTTPGSSKNQTNQLDATTRARILPPALDAENVNFAWNAVSHISPKIEEEYRAFHAHPTALNGQMVLDHLIAMAGAVSIAEAGAPDNPGSERILGALTNIQNQIVAEAQAHSIPVRASGDANGVGDPNTLVTYNMYRPNIDIDDRAYSAGHGSVARQEALDAYSHLSTTDQKKIDTLVLESVNFTASADIRDLSQDQTYTNRADFLKDARDAVTRISGILGDQDQVNTLRANVILNTLQMDNAPVLIDIEKGEDKSETTRTEAQYLHAQLESVHVDPQVAADGLKPSEVRSGAIDARATSTHR